MNKLCTLFFSIVFSSYVSVLCFGGQAAQPAQHQDQAAQPIQSNEYFSETIVGLDFFVNEGKKFLNISGTDASVQSDYILKTDDEIVIDIWGDLDLHYALIINKDGFIVIPKAGKVELRGLSFEEGKKKILNKLADTYDFYIDRNDPGAGKAHLNITLGKIAGVKVYLSGEVVHPGVALLNGANSSVIAAIAAAGGVKKNTGSIRNIQITHTNGTKDLFDLYDFLLKGQLSSKNKYLSDGDIVYVPTRSNKVYALGALVKPGVYESKEGETAAKLIDMAGGFTSSASKKISIFSANEVYDKHNKIIKNEIDYDAVAEYKTHNNDIILANEHLTPKPYSYLEIEGKGIRFNGKLKFENGLSILDYINKAGGLYRDAYKTVFLTTTNEDGIHFISDVSLNSILANDKSANIQIRPGDKLEIDDTDSYYNRQFAFISGYFEHSGRVELKNGDRISDLLIKGKPTKEGDLKFAIFTHNKKDMTIDVESIIKNSDSPLNLKISPFDKLTLTKKDLFVEVDGAVLSPGYYPCIEGKTCKYYINLAGGFTDEAKKSQTLIINKNGQKEEGINMFLPDSEVSRGSKIFVPAKK